MTLNRDVTVDGCLVGAVDGRHAASAQQSRDLILAELLPDQVRHALSP